MAWLTIIIWSFYPIVWLFSEGFASFSVSFEVRRRACARRLVQAKERRPCVAEGCAVRRPRPPAFLPATRMRRQPPPPA